MKRRGPEERDEIPPLFAFVQPTPGRRGAQGEPATGSESPMNQRPGVGLSSTDRAASEARRDSGMARVQRSAESREHGWEADAVSQVREYALTHEHFATEDVRARYGTPEGVNPKAWGPVMKRAERDGIVQSDGFVIVNCSNRSPRVRWRSLIVRGSAA